ncbi:MAG: hypothetical protein ACRDWD_03780 [Acidimicrobiia bacterium]
MLCIAFVRRLKPGRTYEDFLRAWYPDKGFGLENGEGRVHLAVNRGDPSEVLTVGFLDAPESGLDEFLARVSAQEAVRHDRIAEVVEETSLRALYDVVGEFDFSTDEAVAAGRPAGLDRD